MGILQGWGQVTRNIPNGISTEDSEMGSKSLLLFFGAETVEDSPTVGVEVFTASYS